MTGRLPDWWRGKPEPLPLPPPPDAASPEPGPEPAPAPDWWDELYDSSTGKGPCSHGNTIPVHAQPTNELVALICANCGEQLPPPEPEVEDQQASGWLRPDPAYYPRPHPPAWITEDPARAPISPKTRAGLYNATAAGAGWGLGLYDQFAAAIEDCGNQSIGGALVLGCGACLLIAHVWDRRTRHWWVGLAWAARIPLATAILALALWAPAAS